MILSLVAGKGVHAQAQPPDSVMAADIASIKVSYDRFEMKYSLQLRPHLMVLEEGNGKRVAGLARVDRAREGDAPEYAVLVFFIESKDTVEAGSPEDARVLVNVQMSADFDTTFQYHAVAGQQGSEIVVVAPIPHAHLGIYQVGSVTSARLPERVDVRFPADFTRRLKYLRNLTFADRHVLDELVLRSAELDELSNPKD